MATLTDPQTIPPGGHPPWKKWLQRQAWKTRNTARAKSRTTAPPTPAQLGIRKAIAYANELWHYLTPTERNSYPDRSASTYLKHQMERWRDNQPPARAYPGDYDPGTTELSHLSLTARDRAVTIHAILGATEAAQAIIIYRDTNYLAHPDRKTVIEFIRTTDQVGYTYTDSPLKPGTYHYRAAVVQNDGKLGPPYEDLEITVN
jgi:hypothetical protein